LFRRGHCITVEVFSDGILPSIRGGGYPPLPTSSASHISSRLEWSREISQLAIIHRWSPIRSPTTRNVASVIHWEAIDCVNINLQIVFRFRNKSDQITFPFVREYDFWGASLPNWSLPPSVKKTQNYNKNLASLLFKLVTFIFHYNYYANHSSNGSPTKI
jgi:hypothetical protein